MSAVPRESSVALPEPASVRSAPARMGNGRLTKNRKKREIGPHEGQFPDDEAV